MSNFLHMILHFSASSVSLNDELLKMVYQWKMIFNKDVSKEAQEIVFPRKASATNH